MLSFMVTANDDMLIIAPAHVLLSVGRFVSGITEKLLHRFPGNLDGGWVEVQSESTLVTFGTVLGFFFSLTFFNFRFVN